MFRRRPCAAAALAAWDGFPGQLALVDKTGRVVQTNAAWQASGLGLGEIPGADLLLRCEIAAAKGSPGAAELAAVLRTAIAGTDGPHTAVFAAQDLPTRRWLRIRAVPLENEHAILVVREDVSAEKESELELRHRAFHDSLTGLPNRALLVDRLAHAVAVAIRDKTTVAVFFIDLDEFKAVNDQLGHLAGDAVLCQASRRLAECVRTSDTVGRWGGDEFIVIAERLEGDVAADLFARRITDQLHVPMRVANRSLQIRASVGIALLGEQNTAEQLIEAADRALISAREHRRNAAV